MVEEMKTLHPLKPTTFDKIEVGEVFGWFFSYTQIPAIEIKISRDKSFALSVMDRRDYTGEINICWGDAATVYPLSKADQRLWVEE